jgi:hypothetical protein
MAIHSILVLMFVDSIAASATPWSQLWLSFGPVSPSFNAKLNFSQVSCGVNVSNVDLLAQACSELHNGLDSMLGRNMSASGTGSTVILQVTGSQTTPVWPPSPMLESFNISVADGGDVTVTAQSAQGVLYGAYRLLNSVARELPALLTPGILESTAPNVSNQGHYMYINRV